VITERVTDGYVVGPGEGVPGRTPDVKASGRSELSAALAANADSAQLRMIQQAYGITRS